MKKILVIDDLNVNVEAVKGILNTYMPDYEVLSALSGKEGIETAINQQPDTILLDYLMPHMNGFEVCKALKEDERTRPIPVLMVSALGDSARVRTEGLNAGADAFISKPFDIRELVALVNVMLRIKSAEDQLRKRNTELELFIKKQTRHYQDSEERFLQISRHAQEFFWELEPNGIFSFISASAEGIIGYDVSEIIGQRRLWNFAHKHEGRSDEGTIRNKFDRHEVFDDEEFVFEHKDKRKVWLSVNGFPVYDEHKNFMGYRGVCDDKTRRKEAEDKLNKSMEEVRAYQRKLKNLNKELTLTEEKERKRIAEYIHDGIGQTLSLAYIKLSALLSHELPEDVRQSIGNVSGLINNAILESRSLTYDLSPPVLYEFGLLPAIKWKLDQVNKKFNIQTSFSSNNGDIYFESETTVNIYRIICELITNAIKHAGARHIGIGLYRENGNFRFEVNDNGKGFDVATLEGPEAADTYGLFSISERLDSMNGALEINSSPGEGTKVHVIVPAQISN